jgi:alpha-L-fucosidase
MLARYILFVTALYGAASQSSIPQPTTAQTGVLQHTFSMFMHYSLCTYTPWCDGTWDIPPGNPANFTPDALDTDQWMETAVLAGATQVCLTVRHVDGFALWPTSSNNYSVAASPWRNGSGDVVADFVESARKYGISPCCKSAHFCFSAPSQYQ